MSYGQNGSEPSFVVQVAVGRLIETRLVALPRVEDVRLVTLSMREALARVSGPAVVCTDWRAADVFAPDVADALIGMLTHTSSRIQRGAILITEGRATFGLQVERVLREGKNPERRAFRKLDAMLAWLAEVLEPEEASHAKAFLTSP